ncbi:endoribonuclease LACTB2 [Copidosoma floridanum]|uniref:endoribonuclease LACTB2 n=1 Tax=Copidosoma floridanum TaxID=29053 RepID=UPI0006C97772|nr:endoribonuclease LACTB2 [Copidosoma floridanum]
MTSLTAIPLISRLSSKIIRILGCNPGPMTLQGTNTYLVGTGCKRVLIDAGDEHTSGEYAKLLGSVLSEEGATIEHLVVTHWHHDHMGGVPAVQRLLESMESRLATVWKYPRATGEAEEDTHRDWRQLEDGQVVAVEGASLRTVHTPGHTTDHACLLLEEEQALFSGDCILGETSAVFEDLHDYMLSLRKILAVGSALIYPGHGPVVSDPNSKIRAYIDHRSKREAEILDFLTSRRGPCVVMDIVESMYKDTLRALWPAAAVNVNNHLMKLLKENRIVCENDKWSIG